MERVCYRRGDGPGALRAREWLVTNGLGGYASGTVGGQLSIFAIQDEIARAVVAALTGKLLLKDVAAVPERRAASSDLMPRRLSRRGRRPPPPRRAKPIGAPPRPRRRAITFFDRS